MALLAKRLKNFSPASAFTKLFQIRLFGNPHLSAMYSDLDLNADTVIKYTGYRESNVAKMTITWRENRPVQTISFLPALMRRTPIDRKSTRLNSSHQLIS